MIDLMKCNATGTCVMAYRMKAVIRVCAITNHKNDRSLNRIVFNLTTTVDWETASTCDGYYNLHLSSQDKNAGLSLMHIFVKNLNRL